MMTITKNRIKYIQSLQKKRERDAAACFLAEGNRLVSDLLEYCQCQILITTQQIFDSITPPSDCKEIYILDQQSIDKISTQKSAQQMIGVFHKKEYTLSPDELKGKLTIALDTVQDPGNLGTIVRIADWFGIENVICSPNCADIYNPKTVNSTMGALARVKVHYTDLLELLPQCDTPIYGTLLDGQNIYHQEITPEGIIIMGNEGNGISPEVQQLITHKILIPGYPQEHPLCESLNVGVATSIVCAEFRRRLL
ncbi:MAG: RNA methyltransferase [Bacteroidales bacterium]